MQYINRTYQCSNALWEGRFRFCIAQEDNYLLQCQRYIELSPNRAEMVEHPAEYRWSSYQSNAQGEGDMLLTPHFMYEKLGLTAAARQANYRELFRYNLGAGWLMKYVKQRMEILYWEMVVSRKRSGRLWGDVWQGRLEGLVRIKNKRGLSSFY